MTNGSLNPRVKTWVSLAALLALWGLMSFWRLGGPIDVRYDGGVYYILGTSLAQGKGYRLLNEPGEIEAVQYPPLLPLIVAAHQKILGTDDLFVIGQALRLTFLGLYLFLILLAFVFARRHLGPVGAMCVAALVGLNFFTYYLSDLLFTEIPFAIITLLFLLVAGGERRWSTPVCGALAAGAFLLRTSGVALLAAWVVDAALKRSVRLTLTRAGLVALPFLAWQFHVHRVQASEDYRLPSYAYQRAPYQFYNVTYGENLTLIDPFKPELGTVTPSVVVKRFLSNLIRFPLRWGEGASQSQELLSWPLFLLKNRLGWKSEAWISELIRMGVKLGIAAMGVSVLVGGILMLLSRGRLPALYVGATSALICTTPWPGQATRYLMPITPLLALALLMGASFLSEKARNLWPRAWIFDRKVALGLVVVPIFGFQLATLGLVWASDYDAVAHRDRAGNSQKANYFFFDETWRGYERAVEWMMEVAPPGTIVATACPHYFYLRTGLLTVMPPFEADPHRVLELLDGVPADFAIVEIIKDSKAAMRYLIPALESAPDRWRPAYRDEQGGVTIYERIHSSG